ncbi:MAG: helix-turn-helix domain-containing protein, partial [Thermomicrobiales bacterium]
PAISPPEPPLIPAISPAEIETIRHTLGLSKSALARDLLVTYQTIRRWESGQTTPQPGHIRRLRALSRLSPTPPVPPVPNR